MAFSVAGIPYKTETVSEPNSNIYGTYMNDSIRKIDFVLVYHKKNDSKDEENLKRRQFFEENLETAGLELETDQFLDPKGELLMFTKVHVPWNTLCNYAEQLQIKTPLWLRDKLAIRKNNYMDQNVDFVERIYNSIFTCTPSSEKKPRLHDNSAIINWPFKRERIDRYAIIDKRTYFTDKQRIEIAHEILQKISFNPKQLKQRGIQSLVEEKVYITAYPLHDCDLQKKCKGQVKPIRETLHETWASWKMIWHLQPLTDVRNYFGEKIAFYYGFMDVYTTMLIFPSIVGLITFVIGLISAHYNPELDEICLKDNSKSGNHSILSRYSKTTLAHTPLNTLVQNATNHQPTVDPNYVADLVMCPICKPPGCEAWSMIPDGCFQYTWAFRLDNPCSFFLSGFTTLWAIVFLKIWKRREATLAAEWGTEDAEDHDFVTRTEYEERAPIHRRNPVIFESEPYVPATKKYLWLCGSVLGTLSALAFTCVCLLALVLSRIQLYGALKNIVGNKNIDCSRWLIHGCLFVTVVILEKAFTFVAEKLTDFECPKTEKQFINSFLWKVFIFQFLNDFIPIGYAAWLKGKTVKTPLNLGVIDELCDGGCMGEVTELVAVLLLLRLVIGNCMEIGIPLIQNAWKRFRMAKRVDDNILIPQYVKDFHLNATEYDGVWEDYMEMMIQFMFIVLFIPALPVAPFVCFLNNVAEIRIDSIKMLQTNRRAVPIRTSGIGIWNQFLDIISKSGVLCNAALLAFTSDNAPRLFYMLFQQPGQGYLGFTKFSLSSVPTSMFPISDSENEMIQMKHEECWYPDFRQNEKPFNVDGFYYKIYTFRLVIFSLYCIFFFTVMWFINTFISNIPESVKTKIKQKHFLVTKAADVETAIKNTKWNEEKCTYLG